MNLVDTIVAAFNEVVNDLVTALPALIGALIILLVGYIVARVVSGIVRRLVVRSGADKAFAERSSDVYGSSATAMKPSNAAGSVVFWIITLVFIVAAANFLGWTQVSQLINDFLAWLPNLIVAVIILIAAPVVGRVVRRAIEGGSAQVGMSGGRMLGRVAEIAVIAFAVLIAVNQVGIATDLVNILFIGIVAALALALGLSFGLGGREVAAQVTQDWYTRSKEVSARAAAQMEKGQTTGQTTEPTRSTTPAPATPPRASSEPA